MVSANLRENDNGGAGGDVVTANYVESQCVCSSETGRHVSTSFGIDRTYFRFDNDTVETRIARVPAELGDLPIYEFLLVALKNSISWAKGLPPHSRIQSPHRLVWRSSILDRVACRQVARNH